MSGLPYHFLLHGCRAGVLDGAATRTPPPPLFQLGRYAWNGWQVATGHRRGGFQYTRTRNEMLWAALPADGDVVLNTFQLYPPRVLEGGARRWYFVDQTLTQLFDGYGQRAQLPAALVRRTLAWERRGYRDAEMVVANSTWARRSVVEDYGVDEDRTGVVLQAANVDPDVYEAWSAAHTPRPVAAEGPLRLVFVGGDWHRKGLDRLLGAVAAVNAGRRQVEVDVLGLTPDRVPARLAGLPHVTWHGFVDKRRHQRRFLDLLAAADVGCLLSRAEAGGNCLREYHAAGLAVLGTGAGGAGEQVLPDASWVVDPAEPVDAVAQRLRSLLADPDAVQARKDAAWRGREQVLWPASLRALSQLLEGRGA